VTEKTIVLATTIDDSLAMQLLVVLRSACRSLSAGWSLTVFVIGYQITRKTRGKLESGLEGLPVRIEWRTLDLELVRDYWPGAKTGGRITLYYRLFLAEVLPESVDRVLFVDADILVEGDLAELWNSPFDGHTLQAVPDAYGRLMHVPPLSQIDFSEDIAFTDSSAYFNAGILLVDLVRWRQENVGGRAAAFLWKYRGQLASRDQDALNCALAGRWKPLPLTWNFHELPEYLYCWETEEVSQFELKRTFRHPKIIHFIGSKPWEEDCLHVYRSRWWRVAREVQFPEKQSPLLRRAGFQLFYAPHFRLHWHVWRGVIQTKDPWHWSRTALLLLTHPWMLISYPVWKVSAWVRFALWRKLMRRLRGVRQSSPTTERQMSDFAR
jgi:lipopolysaccharide biosynthesis glycosyltransferase